VAVSLEELIEKAAPDLLASEVYAEDLSQDRPTAVKVGPGGIKVLKVLPQQTCAACRSERQILG
jgi:hypothetical protein